MQFSKSNFFLFFLIGWCSFLLAQKQHSINYTSAKDLPNNTIRSLLLDHQGVLWIGTDNGLVKKVNNNFTTYFEEDGLAQNNIWAIAEDNKNNLWLGSFGGGVSIFDGLQFKVINKINGLVHNDVTQLYLFKNFMYVGTYDGLSLIEINTHKVLSAKPKTVKPFKISSFFTYKNQLYCNTVWTGLYKIEVMDNSIELTLVNTQNSIAFFKDKDTIYNSLNGTLFKTTLENYTAKSPKVPQEWGHSIIWDYAKDSQNSLFAAARGLFTNDGGIYEIINNQLVSKAHDFNIPSKNILSLEYDARFQKLYVGSIDLGLFEVDLNSSIQFYEFPQQKVLGIEFVRNTPVFLLSDGLHFTHQQHKKQVLLQQFKQWQEHYINTTKSPLPKHEDYFYEIDYQTPPKDIKFYDLKLFQNQFWINTNIGIYTLNADGTLYNYLPVHTEELNFTPSGQLIETNPYHGLRVYQSVKEFGFKYYDENDINTPTMVVNSLQHQHKTYLLSVFSGLYAWKDHRFISYLKNNIWDETKLRHITDLDKNIAISTEFGDVFIVNDVKEFHILKKIPRAQIVGNTISFLKSYQGFLIIGTEKGLTLYKEGRFIFINHEQGLLQPFNTTKINKNKLYIGSQNGYYTVALDDYIQSTSLIQSVKLSNISINNEVYPFDDNTKNLQLQYHQNSIQLQFSTNPHPYPDKLLYQYRLNKEGDWSVPTQKPEIFLNFLQAKTYEIQVKVIDQSTGFNFTQTLLRLNINPPFWKTWWFILLSIGLVFMILYSFYSYRLRKNQEFEAQKSKIEKRVEAVKLEALLAQMNPHFIFNALNSIQHYIMDQDIENATFYLSEFSQLIRKNLEYCTKPSILLEEEIEYLKSFIRLENQRYNNSIAVKFDIDPQLDTYGIEIPSMLLQPFVENVFVHAFPSRIKNPSVHISFKKISEDLMECIITDNGIGINDSSSNTLHQSKGLSLVKERLQLMEYSADALQITSAKDQGTKVVLLLKL